MNEIGRLFLILGAVMLIIGAVFTFLPGGIPRLPGDIFVKKGNFTFYFPIVSSILLSIILTIILNLFSPQIIAQGSLIWYT